MANTVKFGFIIQPLDVRKDTARKYPLARVMPTWVIEQFLRRKGPIIAGHATGIVSKAGAEAEGWIVACPLTPRMMRAMSLEAVYAKIKAAILTAHECGAEVVGLGAFTSVVGDGGITLQKMVDVPLTTGNAYTVVTAIEAGVSAAEQLEIDLQKATACIVGATGSIGKCCAYLLNGKVNHLILAGRDMEKLAELTIELKQKNLSTVGFSEDIAKSVGRSDLVITVSSSTDAIIQPSDLKSGSVIVDVARPRDVSVAVAKERPDCLVIEGGIIQVPGQPDLGFDFGFLPGQAYACMSETMMLALEGPVEELCTLGKDISMYQIALMQNLAERHGFKLAGFRSFERPVTKEMIEQVRLARDISATITW